MFDQTEIKVKAGSGGDGAISFRREKFVPFGGPDGGDGGDGGSIVIQASASITSLRLFKQKRFFRAGDGKSGQGQKRHGKNGEDVIIAVPPGTVITPKTQVGNTLATDLEQPGQEVVVVRGGKGGLGNVHFTSSTCQAPQIAQKGEAGEEQTLILELKLIADIGIIGYPNVGKSTLLAALSAAKPKIASYPFTTLEPVLGVAEVGEQTIVLAEIPGLIDGAHLGRGLGHDFLRHITRTRVLIHLVDGSAAEPVKDMWRVNSELGLFDSVLASKPQLLAVTKIDLSEVAARRAEIEKSFNEVGLSVFFISAVTGEGVSELMAEAGKMLREFKTEAKTVVPAEKMIFRPQPRVRGVSVHQDDAVFVIVAPELERIVSRVDMSHPIVQGQVRVEINRLGVTAALKKAGARAGDRIRCGDIEWTWY